MNKPSAPILQTARMLDLVPFLYEHQGISLNDLAQHFGISNNEMIQDLDTLFLCGLPGYTPYELMEIDYESGSVSIRNAQTLDLPRTLVKEEIIALLLGLDILSTSLPSNRSDLISAIESLMAKLTNLVSGNFSAQSPTYSEFLKPISDAINNRLQISFKYHSTSQDRLTSRTVIALEIYSDNGSDFIRGFCLTANALRTFRLDRMSEISIGEKFSQSVTQIVSEESRIQARLEVRANLRKYTELLASAITTGQGSSQISISAFSNSWVVRTVIGAGADLAVSENGELRSMVCAKAGQILDLYDTVQP